MTGLQHTSLSLEQCRSARLSRDARFDGQFFVAVKTTGIFCRPICPARLPKEDNVEYFASRAQAMDQGYRPCLRCRPDSAPQSWAWKGIETTFIRARTILEQTLAQPKPMTDVAVRLGISERYLRQLFSQYLGISPKQYQLYQQLLFAKQLLHDSDMKVADIAFAAGFNSLRRFNDAFQNHFRMPPTAVRRELSNKLAEQSIRLPFRGQLNWTHCLQFYRLRAANGVEHVDDNSYSRFALIDDEPVWFKVEMNASQSLVMHYRLNNPALLYRLLQSVRKMFDLDANTDLIEQHLTEINHQIVKYQGLRIPGVWSPWEAGVRAILGQQISVTAAITLLNQWLKLVRGDNSGAFPTPEQAVNVDLSSLKIPAARKQTLQAFAHYCASHEYLDEQQLLSLKGVGPWTVSYIKLRGWQLPDCFLADDLVVKKRLEKLGSLALGDVSPWGSYATLHLWSH